MAVLAGGNERIMRVTERLIPLKKVGTPEDIGDVVACMVSDAFRYMTGATVLVDGGLMLRVC